MKFTYGKLSLVDCSFKKAEEGQGTLSFEGGEAKTSSRFWQSFQQKFGLSSSVFKYFTHEETFKRVAEMNKKCEAIRYCVETDVTGQKTVLGLSNLTDDIITNETANLLITNGGGTDITYADGIFSSWHTPKSGDRVVSIGGEEFINRVVFNVPVDGFTPPTLSAAMIRLICENGMIGYANCFTEEIPQGKENQFSVAARYLNNYNDKIKHAAFRKRLESAQKSWASVHELLYVGGVLVKAGVHPNILAKFERFVEATREKYRVAALSVFLPKAQKKLPALCTVYDLINFLTEAATHHSTPAQSRYLSATVSRIITDEYDQEGLAEVVKKFDDFFLKAA